MDSTKMLLVACCALILGVLAEHDDHPPNAHSASRKWPPPPAGSSNAHVFKQIQQLQLQLEDLETILKERDSSLQDKEKRIVFLENELNRVQQRGGSELEESLVAAQDRASDLKAQLEKLHNDVQKLEIHLHSVKERAETSEATIIELSSKNFKATKTIDRQQKRLRSAEEALQKIEAALQQAEHESAKKDKELAKAAQAWLPLWFTDFRDRFQELAILEWGKHGKPITTTLSRKAYHISSATHELVKLQLEAVKENWIPVVQQQWENVVVLVVPHIETTKIKAINGFESAKSYVSPHVQRIVEALRPHTQLVRTKARPYVDKVGMFVQPYFKWVHKAMKTHIEKAHRKFQELLKLTGTYNLRQYMSKHETLEALASVKLIWFLISAFLLPVLGILLGFSSTFGRKKIFKPIQNSGGSHGRSSHKKRKSKQVDK